MKYLSLHSPKQVKRHDVKPGIYGWVLVNGHNAISWEEKFNFNFFMFSTSLSS
jgi:sugar transferase EpsL